MDNVELGRAGGEAGVGEVVTIDLRGPAAAVAEVRGWLQARADLKGAEVEWTITDDEGRCGWSRCEVVVSVLAET
ncbi:hypothetical protein GCM10010214_31280 [Streptomyces abikoensis]|nr:hypothetical protein GCM10010214_31280 [Streptomyces abikoensis]